LGSINKMPIKTMGLSVVVQRFKQRCYCACAVFRNFELLGFYKPVPIDPEKNEK